MELLSIIVYVCVCVCECILLIYHLPGITTKPRSSSQRTKAGLFAAEVWRSLLKHWGQNVIEKSNIVFSFKNSICTPILSLCSYMWRLSLFRDNFFHRSVRNYLCILRTAWPNNERTARADLLRVSRLQLSGCLFCAMALRFSTHSQS